MSARPEIPAEDAVNIEIDGQPCQARKGAMIIEVTDAGHHGAAFLLPQETVDRGQLPHVHGRGGEGAETVAGLCHAGHRRHEDFHAVGDRHRVARRR